MTFVLCVGQTWMTELTLTIRKYSVTQMNGLAVYLNEGLPFVQDLSLENTAYSYLWFRLSLLHFLSNFFFFYQSPSSFYAGFLMLSSNLGEVLSINPPCNVFGFGDFNP